MADVQKRLDEERERNKPTPNERMAKDAKDFVESYNFFCENCAEDFTSAAFKHIHKLFGDAMVTYRAYCPKCGDESVRLVTHRDNDPYYYLSEKINAQRNEYYLDLMQADDFGFKSVYGDVFSDYNKKLRELEEKAFMKLRQEGFA